MRTYLLRRLLLVLPTLLGAFTVVFLVVHLIPGDPVRVILQDNYNEDSYQAVRQHLGLDQPIGRQYVTYLKKLAAGDLGTSFRSQRPVMRNITEVYPHTLLLAGGGLLLALLVSLPLGVMAALNRNRPADTMITVFTTLGVCLPSFALGIVLILIFSLRLKWLPSLGAGDLDKPLQVLVHLILPAVTVAFQTAALQTRMVRSSLLDVLQADYVRTARAKGLAERVVIYKHALRNAFTAVVTTVGMDLGHLLAGTVVVEVVFSRPGIGNVLLQAMLNRDYPQIQGILLVFTGIVIAINLAVDVVYGVIDPTIRYA